MGKLTIIIDDNNVVRGQYHTLDADKMFEFEHPQEIKRISWMLYKPPSMSLPEWEYHNWVAGTRIEIPNIKDSDISLITQRFIPGTENKVSGIFTRQHWEEVPEGDAVPPDQQIRQVIRLL